MGIVSGLITFLCPFHELCVSVYVSVSVIAFI